MKPLLLPFLIGLLWPCITPNLQAQCSTISINSQIEVDNFKSNYNNCTIIQGNLNIGGVGSDITNLNGFNEVVEITGQFNIESATQLTDFEGMDQLTSVGGNLRIWNNPQLTSCKGLETLNSIGRILSVKNNSNLENLEGLESITTLGRIFIDENDLMTSLKGLGGMTSVQNIPDIPEADGGIVITRNFSLENLHDLSGIIAVAGPVNVVSNSFLTSLQGLENIDYQSIESLIIGTNINLDNCQYANICAYLNEEVGPYTIGNNAFGCENANVVKAACNTTSTADLPKLNFQVSPNPSQEGFVTVQLQQNISRGSLEVFNNQGQKVLSQFFGLTSSIRVELPDVSGIYWLHIRDEQTLATGLHKLLVLQQ